VPLRALAQEKIDDWTSPKHHFHDLKISICTGDYRLTANRKKELDEADLIVMTSEMMNCRARNFESEKSEFLKNIKTLIIDECVSPDSVVDTDCGPLAIGRILDENLNVKVASFNHITQRVEYKNILSRRKKLLKRRWYSLYYKGGNISVTANHLVWCENRGYIPAKDVRKGDVIYVRKIESSGETNNTRDFAWRWLDTAIATWQVGETSDSTVLSSAQFSRVEISRVESTGWNSSKNSRKFRLREVPFSIQHSFKKRSIGNLFSLLSRRKEENKFPMVGVNYPSNCFGGLVYGRWQFKQMPNDNSYGGIFRGRGRIACFLAKQKLVNTIISVSNKEEILGAKISCNRKRQISGISTSLYYPRNEVQVVAKNGGDFLLYVWQEIYDRSSHFPYCSESSSLWHGGLSEKVGQNVFSNRSMVPEESWCCDLEIEDNNNFFVDGVLVHNSHLLTVPRRGDHLEVGLMKFTEINKDCRLVLLSATMPNVNEIADWVSYILTKKDTVLLESTYRPCPLNIHYDKYWDGERTYEDNEIQKVNTALEIVEYYHEDKFLIFAHTKKTGELMKQALLASGINCDFHNADLDKEKRTKVEKQFKEDSKLRVIVATSTLAWGLNLPARRVIILGVHRGLDEVATYDIWQMVGRAGRPTYDPIGDAYILLPERTYDLHKQRVKKPQLIQSQMLEQLGGHYKVLAFHLVSEINQGSIKNRDDVHYWYKRSLAAFQANDLGEEIVDQTIDCLKKCGAVWEEDGIYTVTSIGKIASLFYFSPFDVSDLKKNFTLVFDGNKENDDIWLSVALGNLDTHKFGIVSKAERDEMSMYAFQVNSIFGNKVIWEAAMKAGFAYYNLLNGYTSPIFASLIRNLQFDFPRVLQVLESLDGFTAKWNKKIWFRELELRIRYGVKGPLVYLCQLPHIGKVRAGKLWKTGIKTIQDVVDNPDVVRSTLKLKEDKISEVLQEASKLALSS
jgi:replicative superfamily II helicase